MYGFPRRAATGGTMCRSSAGWRPSKPAETRSFLGLATSDSPTFAGLTTTGEATFGGKITFGAGSYSAGSSQAYTTAADGLLIVGKTGSANDLILVNGSGNSVMEVPAGTDNAKFYGSITTADTTASTSTTTGAVVVGGGVGVAGAGYFGGVVVVGSAASDPSGSNGMIYYDTANNRLRAYVNGAWATVQVA